MSTPSLICQRIWNKEIEFFHKLWFRYLWNPMNVDLRLFKLGFYVRSNNISLKYQGYIFGLESLSLWQRLNFFCPGLCQFKILLFSFVYNTKAHIMLNRKTIVLEALLMWSEVFTIFPTISWVSANLQNIFSIKNLP